MNLRLRLEKLEAKSTPPAGALPTLIVLPTEDEPGHAAVLADIARRQARGERVVVIGPDDDRLAAMADALDALADEAKVGA